MSDVRPELQKIREALEEALTRATAPPKTGSWSRAEEYIIERLRVALAALARVEAMTKAVDEVIEWYRDHEVVPSLDHEDGRGRCTSRETRSYWNADERIAYAYCEKHRPEWTETP